MMIIEDRYKYKLVQNQITTEKYIEEDIEPIAKCAISFEEGTRTWVISSWFVKDGFQHQGHGRQTLIKTVEYLLRKYGEPETIEYVWNGENSYVFEWLHSNFAAECIAGPAQLKYKADDIWESHIYVLDKEKFFNYFNEYREKEK